MRAVWEYLSYDKSDRSKAEGTLDKNTYYFTTEEESNASRLLRATGGEGHGTAHIRKGSLHSKAVVPSAIISDLPLLIRNITIITQDSSCKFLVVVELKRVKWSLDCWKSANFAETILEVMTDFQKFIKEQNERSVERKKEFDPQKRIEQFRKCVADLYHLVDTEWLNEELANGSVTTGTTPITVTEERLGAYPIDAKWIQIGEHRLLFRPVGTIIIGTKARVDLIYKSVDRMFVLVGENIEGARDMISIHVEGEPAPKRKEPGKAVWKIVNPQGRYNYLKANKSNFEKVIMEVINEAGRF